MNPVAGPTTAAVDPGWLRALVLEAGDMLLDAFGRNVRAEHKSDVDLVTETDLAIQDRLVEELRRAFPGDTVVAEEGNATDASKAERVWYVDPLDGTTNFVHGHPFCAISVARWIGGVPEIGAVYAPLLDELYVARAGRGALFERPERGTAPEAMSCSGCSSLDDALLGTGFPYHRGATARLNLSICAAALSRVHGLRRGGSAALDLCHVGLGRLDGYWEMGLAPWDVAAGALVAREAGATVTGFTGGDAVLDARRVVAAAPRLHAALLGLVREVHADPSREWLAALPGGPVPLTGPLPGEQG